MQTVIDPAGPPGAYAREVDDPRWLDQDEATAWRSYLDSAHLMLKVLDRQLQVDAALSFNDYEVLVVLSEAAHGRLRMRDLAEATFTTPSGVSRSVTRLEAHGWVERRGSTDDGRGTEAQLTAAGLEKLVASAPAHVAAVRAHIFDPLTTDEVRAWGAASNRMRASLLRALRP